MRVVLYSAADMQPITILDLPQPLLEFGAQQGRVYLHAIRPFNQFSRDANEPPSALIRPDVVAIDFERFTRRGQEHFLLTTNDDELALLLRASWLPGQQGMVNDYHERIRWLTGALIGSLR